MKARRILTLSIAAFSLLFLLIGVRSASDSDFGNVLQSPVRTYASARPGKARINLEERDVFVDADLREEKVPGEWSVASRPDWTQEFEPSNPVVVKAVYTYAGRGKFAGLVKIRKVEVENRTADFVESLNLRWFLVNDGGGRVLAQGSTPAFGARLRPKSMRLLDIPHIYFNRIVKPVSKGGELRGKFFVVVGVEEVRFATGRAWTGERVASLPPRATAQRKSSAFPIVEKALYSLAAPPSARTPEGACREERQQPLFLPAAYFFAPAQEVTDPECVDSAACYVNAQGQQRCQATQPGVACDLFGCYQGYCGCSGRNTCTDCPDADGDHDPAEPCGGDCDDGDPTRSSQMDEDCGDGVDNDCDDATDWGDSDNCGHCEWVWWECNQIHGSFVPSTCDCCCSPILVDVAGDGFSLTSIEGGVRFDLDGDGLREMLAWTSAGADDAWLALDRDGNGTIDGGQELFGDKTPQPRPVKALKNGFLALAVYDDPAEGGNGDGMIDARDSVFSSLRLWRDANHNGLSEPGELHTLGGLGLTSIETDHKQSKRTDEHGNRFVYRAKVKDARGAQLGRWAWDVWLAR